MKEVEFLFNDTVITNPHYDESGRFNVNPVEYYGEAYLNSLNKFIKMIEGAKNNIKYTWSEETLNSYKELIVKINKEEMLEQVTFFVENHCQLEDGDTNEMLIADLLNQIYD